MKFIRNKTTQNIYKSLVKITNFLIFLQLLFSIFNYNKLFSIFNYFLNSLVYQKFQKPLQHKFQSFCQHDFSPFLCKLCKHPNCLYSYLLHHLIIVVLHQFILNAKHFIYQTDQFRVELQSSFTEFTCAKLNLLNPLTFIQNTARIIDFSFSSSGFICSCFRFRL